MGEQRVTSRSHQKGLKTALKLPQGVLTCRGHPPNVQYSTVPLLVGPLYVTAFPDRALMVRYLPEIAWETEVWVADAPTHLIHFDGERYLGPYIQTE